MYNTTIIQQSTISNYSVKNQRDLIADTAENLSQIGQWTLESFTKEASRIELFLALTRKNVNALSTFPLSPAFEASFKKFCRSYEKLEQEYRTGLSDQKKWATSMIAWANTLTENLSLV